MSMISGQIDELRNAAEFYDGFKAADLMRDAADTIWELRDDLQRANDAVRDAEHDESRAWDRVRKAEADNAKLRELCADMWHVMWACAEQRCKHRENECYVVNGNNGALPSHDECWYERRMRELGVDE